MQKLLFKIGFLILSLTGLFFYYLIFQQSLNLENQKTRLNSKVTNISLAYLKKKLNQNTSILNNPFQTELLLRFLLINGVSENAVNAQMLKTYESLLTTKPTWPYYYSGLAQIDKQMKVFDRARVLKAIGYGPHERTVVVSLSEILFSSWDQLNKTDKNLVLNYLSEQNDLMIAVIASLSIKFAKIYAFCDYIYGKKHVEYATCKQQYWQPLSDL